MNTWSTYSIVSHIGKRYTAAFFLLWTQAAVIFVGSKKKLAQGENNHSSIWLSAFCLRHGFSNPSGSVAPCCASALSQDSNKSLSFLFIVCFAETHHNHVEVQVPPTKQEGAMFLFNWEWLTHAPEHPWQTYLGMCHTARWLPWLERERGFTHGTQMLAELGSGQVHSPCWLRQEFKETSPEIFLAAGVSALHSLAIVCFLNP